MKKKTSPARTPRLFLTAGLLLVAVIVAVDALALQSEMNADTTHAASPSYAVCHAVTKKHPVKEQYFCSTQGCYSDDEYDVTVVGSYEDPNTCSGIADTLQKGAESER